MKIQSTNLYQKTKLRQNNTTSQAFKASAVSFIVPDANFSAIHKFDATLKAAGIKPVKSFGNSNLVNYLLETLTQAEIAIYHFKVFDIPPYRSQENLAGHKFGRYVDETYQKFLAGKITTNS